MPFTNMLLVKTGNVLAHPDNATALLERDELVGEQITEVIAAAYDEVIDLTDEVRSQVPEG